LCVLALEQLPEIQSILEPGFVPYIVPSVILSATAANEEGGEFYRNR
jgi:hypothetical protein